MGIELSDRLAIGQALSSRIIYEEQRWLERPPAFMGQQQAVGGIVASRWFGAPSRPQEVTSEIDDGHHALAIALKSTTLTMFAAQRLVHDGRMMSGAVKVNRPAQALRAIFHSPYDELHLYVPNDVVAEFVEVGYGRPDNDNAGFSDVLTRSDPVVDQLAHALIRAEDMGGPFGYSYAEGIARAIVARVLGRSSDGNTGAKASGANGLPKWRLKRAIDYIEAHLSESIGLADMAAITGLSRMHFAAQFRAATGLRPHEYLLRRRTERAQTLLSSSNMPLVDVAFEVGFKSQSHFTAVFTRFTGETPRSWRQRTRIVPGPAVGAAIVASRRQQGVAAI